MHKVESLTNEMSLNKESITAFQLFEIAEY